MEFHKFNYIDQKINTKIVKSFYFHLSISEKTMQIDHKLNNSEKISNR